MALPPSVVRAEGNKTTSRNIEVSCSSIGSAHARLDCIVGYDAFLLPPVLSASWSDSSLPVPSHVPAARVGHRFPWGQCTWYVALRRLITFSGNAKDWLKNAERAGYEIGSTPRVGAAVVRREGPYGHVAYVESVDEASRTFAISESNVRGRGVISRRVISFTDPRNRGFVY